MLIEHTSPQPVPAVQKDDASGASSFSDELEGWLNSEGDKTLGSLLELFGRRSFAVVFVLLLGVPALPIPTGGATHVFEVIAMLLSLELIVGREEVWLPRRWRTLELGGERRRRFLHAMLRMIRRLERVSRPRLRFLFGHRLSNVTFGVLVIGGALTVLLGMVLFAVIVFRSSGAERTMPAGAERRQGSFQFENKA